MIEEKKLISACSPLAEHLHFETRVVNINPSSTLTSHSTQTNAIMIFPVFRRVTQIKITAGKWGRSPSYQPLRVNSMQNLAIFHRWVSYIKVVGRVELWSLIQKFSVTHFKKLRLHLDSHFFVYLIILFIRTFTNFG